MTVEQEQNVAVAEVAAVEPKSPVKEAAASLKRTADAVEEPAAAVVVEEKKAKHEEEVAVAPEEVVVEEADVTAADKGKSKMVEEPVAAEESAEENDEESGEEGEGAETVEDDLAEIDPANILPDTGRRRTRGVKVDYTKVEAAADLVDEDDEEDEGEFVAEEGSSEQ